MIIKALLSEFDEEMAKTRRSLQRVPNDRLDWRPHEKSMTMGRLATHLAEIPAWTIETLGQESLDIAPPGEPEHQPRFLGSQQEVLDLFDKNVTTGRALIGRTTEEQPRGALVAALGRQGPVYSASARDSARLGFQPHDSSSRATRRLSKAEQYPCAGDLWTLGG